MKYFVAERGEGAYLNDKKLTVSTLIIFLKAFWLQGFLMIFEKAKENNLDYFNSMAINVQAIRRAGAAALDLAYLAAGRFDGFWELKLKPGTRLQAVSWWKKQAALFPILQAKNGICNRRVFWQATV